MNMKYIILIAIAAPIIMVIAISIQVYWEHISKFLLFIAICLAIVVAIWLAKVIVHKIKAYKEIEAVKKARQEFYNSDTFRSLKTSLASFIDDYNALNQHLIELQYLIVNVFKNLNDPNRGIDSIANVNFNTGFSNYSRGSLVNSYTDRENCYYCSLSVLKNARENPYKYICKYFDIPVSDATLSKLEAVSQAIESINQGSRCLQDRQYDLKKRLANILPDLLLKSDFDYFNKCIGLEITINLDVDLLPTFRFEYISAGGNSGQSFEVKMTADVILDFMFFIDDELERKSKASYVRSLVTPMLRRWVKERDNFTCQICGISTKDEPHLLLEIDHIIPVSKGGTSDMSNLQTLCWKCNRSKSNKL